jgi:hypothetical protein
VKDGPDLAPHTALTSFLPSGGSAQCMTRSRSLVNSVATLIAPSRPGHVPSGLPSFSPSTMIGRLQGIPRSGSASNSAPPALLGRPTADRPSAPAASVASSKQVCYARRGVRHHAALRPRQERTGTREGSAGARVSGLPERVVRSKRRAVALGRHSCADVWSLIAAWTVQPDFAAHIQVNGTHENYFAWTHTGQGLALYHRCSLRPEVRQSCLDAHDGNRLHWLARKACAADMKAGASGEA